MLRRRTGSRRSETTSRANVPGSSAATNSRPGVSASPSAPTVVDTTGFGFDRLTDQRVGGAIMWVTGDVIFLAAASGAFFLWLAEEEEMQRKRERITG